MHASLKPLAERVEAEILADMQGDRLVWPSLPQIVLRIREVLQKPDASVKEVTDAVAADPAMASRLLRVANSVYYGGTTPCRDLRSAVVRLGADALQNAMMMVAVARVFSIGKLKNLQPHLRQLWGHSVLVAALSELLAKRVDGVEPEVAMLAGLLHDIGRVPVLLQAHRYPKVFDNPALLSAIVDGLHARIGARVLDSWRMPGEFVRVAGAHAYIRRELSGPVALLDVVIAANVVAGLPSREADMVDAAWTLPALRRLAIEPETMWAIASEAEQRRDELEEMFGMRR